MIPMHPIDELLTALMSDPKRACARSERGTLVDEHNRLRGFAASDPDLGASEAHERMMTLDDERATLEAEEDPETLAALDDLNRTESFLREESDPRNGPKLRKLAEDKRALARKMKHGARLAELAALRAVEEARIKRADVDADRLDKLSRLAEEGRIPA